MNKDQKYYNPYPFAIRILNDLGEPYIMAPQDYSKVLNGRYEQSKLTLLPLKEEREFCNDINIDLDKDCVKADLIPIAWAVGLDGVDQSMTKSDMIKAIEEKIFGSDACDDTDEFTDDGENLLDPDQDEDLVDRITDDDGNVIDGEPTDEE